MISIVQGDIYQTKEATQSFFPLDQFRGFASSSSLYQSTTIAGSARVASLSSLDFISSAEIATGSGMSVAFSLVTVVSSNCLSRSLSELADGVAEGFFAAKRGSKSGISSGYGNDAFIPIWRSTWPAKVSRKNEAMVAD